MKTDPEFVGKQMAEVISLFPELESFGKENGPWCLSGPFHFKATFNKKIIEETISIAIRIPTDFPDKPPVVKVIGNSPIKGFPHIYSDGTFCLATPIRIKIELKMDSSLLNFIYRVMIPFLFSAFYWKDTRKLPYGECAHGGVGILEEYCRIFGIHDPLVAERFLRMLSSEENLKNRNCPCSSGKDLYSCHYQELIEVSKIQSREDFRSDLYQVYICKNNLK